jgi:site-specific DNA recombinase
MQRDSRGRRGFGHTQDRSEVVAGEAALILEAAQRVLDGATLSSIVDDWNRRGVTTTTGGPWRINALSALLVQPRLAGLDGGDGPPPAIIDGRTHDALVALRHARRKSNGRQPGAVTGRPYLLTGFLRCWRCGSRLGGITPRATTVQPHYRCPSRGAGGCSGVVVRAAHADNAARDVVLRRVDDPEFTRSVTSRQAILAAEQRAMTAMVADAVMGRDPDGDGIGLWTDGRQIDGQAWGQLKQVLEAKAGADASELPRQTVLSRQRRLCGSGQRLRACWDGMDVQERRSIVDAVVDHFVVLPAPRLRSKFTPERLQPVWRD